MRINVPAELGLSLSANFPKLLEIDVLGYTLQEGTHWLGKPSPAAAFEPAEVSTSGSCAEDYVLVLLDLLDGKPFAYGDLCSIRDVAGMVTSNEDLQDRLQRVWQTAGP